MRRRLISAVLAVVLITVTATFAAAVSGCSGCSGARQSIVLADSSGCGGSGGGTPTKPANVIEANCTRDLEGPDNSQGQVTASISFTCSVNLDAVTLVISIWHGSGGGSSVGDRPEKSNTCESIETGDCVVSVPCTEGVYRAAFNLTATVDGKLVTDSDVTDKVTYSAGDCTL